MVRASWRILEFCTSSNISATAEARVIKICARVDSRSISHVMTNCPPKWAWLGSQDVLNFWQVSVNISKMVHYCGAFQMQLLDHLHSILQDFKWQCIAQSLSDSWSCYGSARTNHRTNFYTLWLRLCWWSLQLVNFCVWIYFRISSFICSVFIVHLATMSKRFDILFCSSIVLQLFSSNNNELRVIWWKAAS